MPGTLTAKRDCDMMEREVCVKALRSAKMKAYFAPEWGYTHPELRV